MYSSSPPIKQAPLPPGRLRSFVLVNQLDEPLRVVAAYNVTEVGHLT